MTDLVVDHYTLGQQIGSGGMGDVYRGVDLRTNDAVAIKVLKSEIATQEMVQRFVREGEALRQLNHPNIVKLLDAVHENGHYYVVMELVEGGSLDELIKRTRVLPIRQVLNIALDLADALTRAHRLNIIHRDIKPANVLLANDGMLRLTDFGIARVIGSDITETGMLLGTIAYMAPEVLQGVQADARSDIWSMGLMLFEMLAGKHPFRPEADFGGLIHGILNVALPDLEAIRPDAPTALVDVINRMLMKDPAERVPRMRLVGAELEAILADESEAAAPETQPARLGVKLEPGARFETPAVAHPAAVRNNLPAQTTPFVGRDAELSEIEKLLDEDTVRLLTIVGPGGMGKTRLSLEVAGKFLQSSGQHPQFAQGIYFIDLAPVTSADYIVGAAAEAVGYAFQQDGRDPQQQLFDFLREKHVLLIVDNFEHVISGRTFAQDVLQAAPYAKILVTSREKLNLNAETVFILSGMTFPNWETPADALEYAAVKLFLQSARRVRRDFELDAETLTYVSRICRLVQGTPLGILLAASWLDALSPREIAEEIGHSLDFLESELHDLPERQRSLRAVFEYSWNLLTEPEQVLFAQFAMFHGGFTRDAALAITGTNLRALTTAVNKSLLRRDSVYGRYEVHELLRQFAEEKLTQSADGDAAYRAYSQYYLELVGQLAPKLKGYGQLEALNLIDSDFENIRAAWSGALKHANAAGIESAIEGLTLYLTFRNRWMDGEQLFGAARQVWMATDDAPTLLAAKLLARFPGGAPLEKYRAGLAIAQQHGDAFEVAFCRRLVGHWLSHTDYNQDEGVPLLEASMRGYHALGDRFYEAEVLDDLGWSHVLMVDFEHQVPLVQQSLDLRREIGDKIGIANSLRNLGGSSGGFYDDSENAFTYWQEAKEIAYEMNDRLSIAWNAILQGANLIFKAEFERAEQLIDEATPHATDLNDPVLNGLIYLERAAIAGLRDEDYETARRLTEKGLALGSPPDFLVVGLAAFNVSVIVCGVQDLQLFRDFDRVLNSSSAPFTREEFFLPFYCPIRILQLAERGERLRAAELLQALLTFVPSFAGHAFAMGWARQWGVLIRLREQLEAELGAEVYRAAQERGAVLPMSELIRDVNVLLDDIRR